MKKLIAAMVPVVLLVAGCSGGGYGTVGSANLTMLNGNPGGSTPPTHKAATAALFQPSAGLLPYPYDVYFAGSTDGTLNIQPANRLIPAQDALNALDGFSTTAVIRERFGGPIDAASLGSPAAVVVVHITTDNKNKAPVAPPAGVIVPLTGCVTGATACAAADYAVAPAPEDPSILEITPLKPLAASSCLATGPAMCATGEGYLVLLTKAITVGGKTATPDTDYATIETALASGGAKCPSITDQTLNGICQLTGAHLQIAQAVGLNPANIVVSFSFTTESTIDSLVAISSTDAQQAMTQGPPAITVTKTPLTTANVGGAGIADVYVGVLTVPYYLSKSAPLTEYWHAPPFPLDATSTFTTRFNPLPVKTQDLLIPVLATVPNAASGQTAPPGGWPVLIFQHAVLRNREDMLAVADSFAQAGFVVVAIDLPLHGAVPINPLTTQPDPLYASLASPLGLYAGLGLPATGSIERTFDLDLENNATGAPTPDGEVDPTGSHFINLTSLLTSRDNVRQGVADLVELTLAVPTLNVPGGIAHQPVHFLGHSLGAIEGGLFLGVVPPNLVSTGTLASPGGGISQLLADSPSFAPAINAGLLAASGGLLRPGTTPYAQWVRDVQTVVDSGDPINFIALATAQHPIHVLQVVGSPTPPSPQVCIQHQPTQGCPDQVVPNSATQRLIVASGEGPSPLTRIPAPAAPGPLLPNNSGTPPGYRAYVNFLAGEHGSIIDNVNMSVTAEMQTEAVSFAASSGATMLIGNPGVIQP